MSIDDESDKYPERGVTDNLRKDFRPIGNSGSRGSLPFWPKPAASSAVRVKRCSRKADDYWDDLCLFRDPYRSFGLRIDDHRRVASAGTTTCLSNAAQI